MIGQPLKLIEFLYVQDKDKLYEVKEYKKKRSLNQNSYAWELITKISNKMRLSKEEVYFQMLKDYGQSEDILLSANANIIGYAKYYELIGKRKMESGNIFNVYRLYKGSSEFDTKEMSIFIDGIILEAKSIGIDVITYDEIKRNEVLYENK